MIQSIKLYGAIDMQRHNKLIESLKEPNLYKHDIDSFRVRETHISTILLTGPYAYKFKKPVEFDFVDFRQLDDRKYYCEQELKLNQRLCPNLYDTVIPVNGTPENPSLNGNGPTIEYALKMTQFPEDNLLSHLADNDRLDADLVDATIEVLAQFHGRIDDQPPEGMGTSGEISDTTKSNLSEIENTNLPPGKTKRYERISDWLTTKLSELETVFEERRKTGHVRNCHGDVHLNNIVTFRDEIKIFDCIEFNKAFRWIDVIDELAFLAMDLETRSKTKFAHRAVNDYLDLTGDHSALQLLDFYRTHRALVRCKVNLFQSDENDQDRIDSDADHYLKLAESYTRNRNVVLLLAHGLSGSGKTTVTQQFIDRHGAIRVRSDVERKRLADVDFKETPDPQRSSDVYSEEMTIRTYEVLETKTKQILQAGFPAIVDATFLKRHFRRQFINLAQDLDVPVGILTFQLPEKVLKERLRKREHEEESVSDADATVLPEQKEVADPLENPDVNSIFRIESAEVPAETINDIDRFFGKE